MALAGNSAYIVWQEGLARNGGGEILYTKSQDFGANFGTVINLSNSPSSSSTTPYIAAAGRNVYVVWEEGYVSSQGTPQHSQVYFRRSIDSGATFGRAISLADFPGNAFGAKIAVSGNYVYILWYEGLPDNYNLYFKASADGGATFGAVINLGRIIGIGPAPLDIEASGRNIYIVWEEFVGQNREIQFRRSTDGGRTFENAINLSSNPRSSGNPKVAVSQNNVFIVWVDRDISNYDILYRRSTDGGRTFENAIQINGDDPNLPLALDADVVASRNNVYIIWHQGSALNDDIFYRRSTDGGQTFSTAINLSQSRASSTLAKITLVGNNVYVVWIDRSPGNYDVFYRRSTDSGARFGEIINISHNPSDSGGPQVHGSSSFFAFVALVDRVHVNWVDRGSGGNSDIFYVWNSTYVPATGGLPAAVVLPPRPAIAVYCNNYTYTVYERSFSYMTTFEVIDSKGNIVLTSTDPIPPNTSFIFNLTGVTPGRYTLNIYENTQYDKLVIPELVVSRQIDVPCIKEVKVTEETYVPYWIIEPTIEDLFKHKPNPENITLTEEIYKNMTIGD